MSASSTDAEALWSFGPSHCAVGREPSGSRHCAVMNRATRSSVIFGSGERAPRPGVVNHFRSEEAGDRVGERVVIEIATATARRCDAGVAQVFGVANGYTECDPFVGQYPWPQLEDFTARRDGCRRKRGIGSQTRARGERVVERVINRGHAKPVAVAVRGQAME